MLLICGAELFFPDYTFLICGSELFFPDYTLLIFTSETIQPDYTFLIPVCQKIIFKYNFRKYRPCHETPNGPAVMALRGFGAGFDKIM